MEKSYYFPCLDFPPPEAEKNQKPIKTPDDLFMFLRNEVASGYYDCLETIRRLRQLENDGIFINSLIYGLLRVQNRMRNRMQKQESRG